MPMEQLVRRLTDLGRREVTDEVVYRLADEFRVSYTAMVLRCAGLQLISSSQAAELRTVKPSKIEKTLRLKEQRTSHFAADDEVPRLSAELVQEGRLPQNWATDFSERGPMHLRLLQSEAAKSYLRSTEIAQRYTSITELFEMVAKWVAINYPWR